MLSARFLRVRGLQYMCHDRDDFCCLLIPFANSLDQARRKQLQIGGGGGGGGTHKKQLQIGGGGHT